MGVIMDEDGIQCWFCRRWMNPYEERIHVWDIEPDLAFACVCEECNNDKIKAEHGRS